MRWMRYTLRGSAHVFTPSRVTVTFRLGAVIAESRPGNYVARNDGSGKLYKREWEPERWRWWWWWWCARSMEWRQERECVHFGATDIDHPLFFVWFCCNIAHMFVPDFRGSCVINGPMDLNRTLSFSLFFLFLPFPSPPLLFFCRERSRSCLLAWRIRDTEEGFWIFICEIVFHSSLRFVGAFRKCLLHASQSFTFKRAYYSRSHTRIRSWKADWIFDNWRAEICIISEAINTSRSTFLFTGKFSTRASFSILNRNRRTVYISCCWNW